MSKARAPVPEPERLARVALSRIGEPGDPRLTDLVHELGAETVLAQPARPGDRARAGGGPGPADHLGRARDGSSRPPRREGSGSSCPATTSGPPGWTTWPTRPTCTSAAVSPSGCGAAARCASPKPSSQAVAVVGSRSATTYGGAVASDIAGVLARESWTVVSGAAFGIDQAAHRGALAQPWSDGRGAGLRGRPRLSVGAPAADRLRRRGGAGGLGGGAGLRADADPVPGPQPADRGRLARDGGRRGGDPQRCPQHRELGGGPRTRRHGGARSGHERARRPGCTS